MPESWIISLISGLIGAVIGGILSYLGAIQATNRNIEATLKLENERLSRDKAIKHKTIKLAFSNEIKQNLKISQNWQINYAKALLATNTWNLYKGEVDFLKPDVLTNLINMYSEIERYNSLVIYERERVSMGHGAMDVAIQNQVKVVEDLLTEFNFS